MVHQEAFKDILLAKILNTEEKVYYFKIFLKDQKFIALSKSWWFNIF